MFEFFSLLFDTRDFPNRWNCGNWSEGHGYLHIFSDIATFGAYMAMPVVLAVYASRRRNDIVFPSLVWLFVAFILACGFVHLVEAIIFWWPIYRVSGLLKLATAVVSWGTVIGLVRIAPYALDLPGLKAVNLRLTQEIGARKQAESRLEQILQSMSAGVLVSDAQGKLQLMNRAAMGMLNSEKDSIDPESWIGDFQLLKSDGTEYTKDQLPLARAGMGEYVDAEEVTFRRDGSDSILLCRANPVKTEGGSVAGGVVVFNDITLFKKMQREREERYLQLEKITAIAVEASSCLESQSGWSSILTTTAEVMESEYAQIVFKDHLGDMLCYEHTMEASRASDQCNRISKADIEAVEDEYTGPARSNITHGKFKIPYADLVLNNGAYAQIGQKHDSVFSWILIGNRDRSFDADDVDILQRTASILAPIIAAQVKFDAETHEHSIVEEELRARQQQLEHLSRTTTLGELTTGIAHELNQPLTAIANFADACQQRLDGVEFPMVNKVAANLDRIQRLTHQSGEVIRRIRNLARPHQSNPKPLEMCKLVDETLEMLSLNKDRSEVVFEQTHRNTPLWVGADSVEIQQVLMNLIRNALEATAESQNPRIRLRTFQADSVAHVFVEDNGIGLIETQLSTYFQPLYSAKSDGLGIGLKICHTIIERHSGRISACNNPDGGATIEFTLPCLEASRQI